MNTATDAPATAQAAAPVELPDEITIEDARSIIDGWEDPEKNQNIEGQEPEAEREEPAAAKPDTSKEENADPEKDPGEEETKEADPAEEPSIEPPRSWTKEAKDQWNSLPRATQEYLSQREQERDRGLRQSQNELAEQRKAFEAEREAVRQLKQQYESKLPDLAKTLEQALQNDFGDIKDFADVRKLQSEDPFRFQQWQLRQMELAKAQQDQQEAQKRNAEEVQQHWNKHVQDESAKFVNSLSDADQKRINDLNKNAPAFLMDRGFTQEELNDLASGKDRLSIYDHRVQSLILDGMKFRDLQNAPKAVAAKPLPPVQKPGTTNRPAPVDAQIAALERKSELTEAEGFALLELRAKAARR